MTDPVALARDLVLIAGDLDRMLYPNTGRLRQAARALLEVDPPDDDGCRGCGHPIDQPERGRRRVWCSEGCRDRHRRR